MPRTRSPRSSKVWIRPKASRPVSPSGSECLVLISTSSASSVKASPRSQGSVSPVIEFSPRRMAAPMRSWLMRAGIRPACISGRLAELPPETVSRRDAEARLHLLDPRAERLELRHRRQHAARAHEVGAEPGQPQARRGQRQLAERQELLRRHPFAPVAHLQHDDDVVHPPLLLGRRGQRPQHRGLGVEAGVAKPHHVRRLGDGGDAQHHDRAGDAAPAQPPHVVDARFAQARRAAAQHRPSDQRQAAGGLGHAEHRHALRRAPPHDLAGVFRDRLQVDGNGRGRHGCNPYGQEGGGAGRLRDATRRARGAQRTSAMNFWNTSVFGDAEHLLRRALLGDLALVHEDDLGRDVAGEAHLVGDDDHGPALGGERLHHPQHLADQLGVERRGRLVEQDRVGLHARARGRSPRAAAGRRRAATGYMFIRSARPTRASSASARAFTSAFGCFSTCSGPSMTFSSTVRWVQRLNCWNTMPSRCRARSTWRMSDGMAVLDRDLLAVHPDPARGRRIEHVQAAQEGRLARAAGAEDRDHVVVARLERDALQDLHRAEGLVDVLGPQDELLRSCGCPPAQDRPEERLAVCRESGDSAAARTGARSTTKIAVRQR